MSKNKFVETPGFTAQDWADALMSGKYDRAAGVIGAPRDKAQCCLGVLRTEVGPVRKRAHEEFIDTFPGWFVSVGDAEKEFNRIWRDSNSLDDNLDALEVLESLPEKAQVILEDRLGCDFCLTTEYFDQIKSEVVGDDTLKVEVVSCIRAGMAEELMNELSTANDSDESLLGRWETGVDAPVLGILKDRFGVKIGKGYATKVRKAAGNG